MCDLASLDVRSLVFLLGHLYQGTVNTMFLAEKACNSYRGVSAGPTFDEDNQRDVRKRPSGGVQKPSSKNLVENPKETLGVTSFGFTSALCWI